VPGTGGGPPSDAELLRRHVAGDSDAFGELFRRHHDRLWAVALRTTCDPEEAADALQDALVSAFRRAADFRGDSAVTTWLHRIVVNAALDRLRRRAVRPAVSADERALEALAPPGPDPARSADTRLDIDAALRILPPPQRAALVLVDMLGFSVDDAAAILDVSPGTIKSRCARARARLVPYVAHLRAAAGEKPPGDRRVPEGRPGRLAGPGNRTAGKSVSPAQGGDA
jgi:RNA polymerase sigma-70 factor (ECF subfamily)